MALTYFGACDSAGVASGSTSNNDDNGIVFWRAYTCPGSGNQTVQEIAAMMFSASGGTIRLAIYDSTFTTLLAQSASYVPSSTTTDTWDAAAISAITLVGGTDYGLAITLGNTGSNSTHVDGTRSDGNFKTTDYTAGFPAPLDTPASSFSMYPIRVGVEAAGGAAAARVPQSRPFPYKPGSPRGLR